MTQHRYAEIPVTTSFVPAPEGWRVVTYAFNNDLGRIEVWDVPMAGWNLIAYPRRDGTLDEQRDPVPAYWNTYEGFMEDSTHWGLSNGVIFVFGPGQDERDAAYVEMAEARLRERLLKGKYVESSEAFSDLWTEFVARRTEASA